MYRTTDYSGPVAIAYICRNFSSSWLSCAWLLLSMTYSMLVLVWLRAEKAPLLNALWSV